MPFGRPLVLLIALLPTAAAADIYKWTDENGQTVYSNSPPAKPARVKNVAVLIDESKVPAPTPEQRAQAEALRTQQALLERMYALERQIQAMQYAQYQAAMAPAPAGYYGGYSSPASYPYGYGYPLYVVPTRFVRPAPFVPARFVSHHRGGARRGMR
jgi:uncharacterized protein DUF4124